jgi:hypothetical protein
VYIALVNHHTTLEITTSTSATWKIPASNQYGQHAALLDMTRLGEPTSATMFVVYTNTAGAGVNRIGIVLGSAPSAAGTTVTPLASSVATLANSSAYPQTIEQEIDVADLGTTKQWLQIALDLASNNNGPNIMAAGLVLYYDDT